MACCCSVAVVEWWAEAYSAHVVAANPSKETINRSCFRFLDAEVSPTETGLPRVVQMHL